MLASLEKQESIQVAPTDGEHEMVNRLNHSFEAFIGIAEGLKEAYERLREKADAMDLKLKEANARLSGKVMELDGMTRRLNDLLQNMPSAVVAADENGRITHFNRAAEKLLKIASDDVMGRRPEKIEGLKEALLLARNGEPAAGGERTVLDRDGRRLIVTSSIAELENAEGLPAGRIEILIDLTETDRLQREVHRLDTLAALGEMAASVAHQIRNPLNGVEGFASLLHRNLEKEDSAGQDMLRYSKNIVQGVREVNAIISGMLMLTRSEPITFEPVSLDRMAGEVVETIRQAAEQSGSPARITFKPGPVETWVHGDGLKLKQAILNLAHNALEALSPEGPRIVRISTRRIKDSAELRVTDSGIGMDADLAAKALRPFFTTRESGTGLGLSVASKVVDLHSGSLRLRSMPGVGTVFKITLHGLAPAEWDGDET